MSDHTIEKMVQFVSDNLNRIIVENGEYMRLVGVAESEDNFWYWIYRKHDGSFYYMTDVTLPIFHVPFNYYHGVDVKCGLAAGGCEPVLECLRHKLGMAFPKDEYEDK